MKNTFLIISMLLLALSFWNDYLRTKPARQIKARNYMRKQTKKERKNYNRKLKLIMK